MGLEDHGVLINLIITIYRIQVFKSLPCSCELTAEKEVWEQRQKEGEQLTEDQTAKGGTFKFPGVNGKA